MINPNEYVDPETLGLFFVGGCGEFGMNLTCYLYAGKLYIVDCGLAFAEDHELGIDAHIPEIDEIIESFGGISGYLITHGHEDHIGALPHFLSKWPADVYCTPWASKLLADKLARRGLPALKSELLHVMRPGTQSTHDTMTIDWIGVPHSIPDCCSLIIRTQAGQVYHSGDFKLNHHPGYEPAFDSSIIELRQRDGFLATVVDSTNAPSAGSCPSESTVADSLKEAIQKAQGAIVFATFSSNLWRLKTVIEISRELGRRIHIAGAGVSKTLEFATDLGMFTGDANLFVNADEMKALPRREVLILATGSQGEHRSALKRILAKEYAPFQFQTGDRLILSSRTIPGNEKSVFKMVSECHRLGVDVITSRESPSIHVSGHAYADDIRHIIKLTQPRYHIPVHGTFTQLEANTQLAKDASIIRVANGTLLRFKKQELVKQEDYDLRVLYIDSWSQQAIDYETLRSRLKIGDSGLFIVSGSYSRSEGRIRELDFEVIGLGFPEGSKQSKWLTSQPEEMKTWFKRSWKESNHHDLICEELRRHIRRQLTALFVKKPVVIVKLFAGD